MKAIFLLALLGTDLFMAPAGNAAPPPKTREKGKKTATKGSAKAKGQVATRAGSVHYARGKNGRLVRAVVHTPPPPSYQLHPDPDRYIEIQRALADRGYFKGEANGEWNDDSVDALKRFQAGASLPDDGKISALTLTGLGLGPRHDGSTASSVPQSATEIVPLLSGTPVNPAAAPPGPTPPDL